MANSFGEKLSAAFEAKGQLCVGIDPHSHLLTSWDLDDSPKGLREFSLRVVEAASGLVSAVKPQVSFFERFGATGYEVLSEVTQFAHSEGLLVIADAKRGDIGSTMDAYLEAWFGDLSGLYADAVTTSPYLGLAETSEVFGKWQAFGKGFYSLVATSNSQGESVQLAQVNGRTLASDQFAQLSGLNANPAGMLGSRGAVLGATLDLERYGIKTEADLVPILAPGFGAQGAKLSDARAIYKGLSSQVSFSVSRSILDAGARDLSSAIVNANSELVQGLTK
ncbi:MAG: orotidine-5'-phosphate decarboxylase [Rhodoluna sp.]|nr:orotidine-5'-phosphate decarboxylase [Rhodoluna sp.]